MVLKIYKLKVIVLAAFIMLPAFLKAQGIPPGWDPVPFPTSHIISVPPGADPNIDGVPLEPGVDYIGAFFDDNGVLKCCGVSVWDPGNTAVFAYADDNTEPEKTQENRQTHSKESPSEW